MVPAENNYKDENDTFQFAKAKITVLPIKPYFIPSDNASVFSQASSVHAKFNQQQELPEFDPFAQKLEISNDNVSLLLEEIKQREELKNSNLQMLYEEILKIDNWRLQRPYPASYTTDKLWFDLNKTELDTQDKIRRELKDSARDLSFLQTSIRESLLELKVQNQKSQLLGGLEMELEKQTGDKNL